MVALIKKLRAGSVREISPLAGLLLSLPAILLILLFFVWPVMLFLGRSFEGGTLEQYEKVADSAVFSAVLLRTLMTAAVVTVASLVFGFPVAWLLARLKGWKLALLAFAVLVPLWSSILVRTYAWTVILQRRGLINNFLESVGIIDAPLKLLYTNGAVVLAMTHVLMPFMILPLWNTLRQIPEDYGKASLVLGAGETRTFTRITLPLAMPGIGAGCLFVFLISLGFFVTPQLVGSPRSMMVASLITQQVLQLLNWPFAAALSTIVVAAVLILLPFTFRALLPKND